jgi:hypothetical protein
MKTNYSITKWLALLALLTLNHLVSTADAAVTFTVTPAAVSNTYSGSITLLVSNVPTGDTVVVQKFLNLNTNGVIDGSDWLVQQFQLTDGTNFVIGGVTNFNVPGDLNATTGAITATLNFKSGDFRQNIVGKYLFKLSSPVGRFTPITNVFTVTNFPFGQKFTGNVVSNGTSTVMSNAVVLLFSGPAGQSSPVAGTVANNAGLYTIQVPVGTYSPVAFRSNYLANFSTAPLLTLGSLATITTNLTMTNATSTISGRLVDAANPSLGLPGIFLPMMSTNGMVGVGFTDTNGNFTVGVRSGQWKYKCDDPSLILHGYVEFINGTNLNAGTTYTGAVFKANALIYGSVKDTLANPMPGIDVYLGDNNVLNLYQTDGYTDQNGNYVAGVLGGLGTNQVWMPEIAIDHNNGNPTNYLFSVSQLNGSLATNTATLQNFTGMLATNHIVGSVKINSTNIVGVGVGASQTISGVNFFTWTHTDANGNYALNVGNGTWDVSVYCSAGGYPDGLDFILGAGNYVCPSDQFPTINNNNATNNFVVQGCNGISIITASPLPVGEVNVYYDQFLQASSCNGNFTWAFLSGTPPPGLNANFSTGEIYGTPTTAGTYTMTIQVTDGNNLTTNKQFSGSISNALQVATTTLPNGTNGSTYSQVLQATAGVPFGGASPYSWSVASGSLPANLTLATNGLLSGVLATNGTFNFTAQVTDALGGSSGQGLALNIVSTNNYPPLMVGTGGGQILIYWPLSAGTNYTVQMTTNLATGPWVTATNGVPAAAFIFTNQGPAAFFRLH